MEIRKAIGSAENYYQYKLAQCNDCLGVQLAAVQQYSEAEKAHRHALALLEELPPDYQNTSRCRGLKANVLRGLAKILDESYRRHEEAVELVSQALQIDTDLVSEFPDEPEHRVSVAFCHLNLGFHLQRAGRKKEAEGSYRKAIELYTTLSVEFPDLSEHRYWLARCYWPLGWLLQTTGQLQEAEKAHEQGIDLFEKLTSELPQHSDVRDGLETMLYNLAETRLRLRKHQEAARAALKLAGAFPDGSEHKGAGRFLLRCIPLAQQDEAISEEQPGRLIEQYLSQAFELAGQWIESNPGEAEPLAARGYLYARRGQWKEAASDFARALELDPENHWNWCQSAPLYLQLDDVEGYRRHCRRMLERFGQTESPKIARRTVKACGLAPDVVEAPKALVRLADLAMDQAASDRWSPTVCGQANYRVGEFERAVERLGQAANIDATEKYHTVNTQLLLAMAQQRLGRIDEARQSLAEAGQIMETQFPQVDNGDLGDKWHDWLICQILRREAESLDESDETAISELHKAIDQRPDDPALWLRRARFRANRGQWAQASADFARARELDPQGPQVLQEMAQFHLRTDDFDKAISLYSRAIGLEPDNAQLRIGRGEIHEKVGQWSQAVADFSGAIELSPDHAELWIRRGEAYEKSNQWDKAAADFCKALELQPQHRKLWKNRAEDYVSLKQWDAAMVLYSKLVELAPDYAGPWWDRAGIHLQRGDYDKAIADCNEAIRLRSDHIGPYCIRGKAYLAIGEIDKGIADFHQAIRIDPDNLLRSLTAFRDALTTVKRFDEAAEPARRMVEIRAKSVAASPKDRVRRKDLAWAHYELGNILFAAGKDQEAADAYRPAFDLFEQLATEFPDVKRHQNHLAFVLATCPAKQFRDGPRAVASAKRALQLSPSNPDSWYILGIAQYTAGDYSAAIDSMERGRSLSEEVFPTHVQLVLAVAHWQSGDRQRGRELYDEHAKRTANDASGFEYRAWRAEADNMFATTEPDAKDKKSEDGKQQSEDGDQQLERESSADTQDEQESGVTGRESE